MSLVLRKYTLEIYTEIFKGTGAMMYATYSQKVLQKVIIEWMIKQMLNRGKGMSCLYNFCNFFVNLKLKFLVEKVTEKNNIFEIVLKNT